MLLDKQNTVSDNQSLVQTFGSTYVSTNAIDLGATGTIPGIGGSPVSDPGRAPGVEMLVQITEAVASAGEATVDFQLISSAAADLSSPTVLQTTGVIAKTALVAGYQARLAMPAGISQRYLGVQYAIGTATPTAGKVTAGIVANKQTNPFVG